MFHRLRQHLNRKRFGTATMAAVALSLFLVGFAMAAGLHRHEPFLVKGEGQAAAPTAPSATAPNPPGSFAELAKALGPTVVNIRVTKIEKATGSPWPAGPEGPMGELFRRFFGEPPQGPANHRVQAAGSGVIIGQDGYLLTNNHVVEGAQEVLVTLSDQQEYPAQIVGRDPQTDLAVLKIEAQRPLPMASMGDSDRLEVGDWVLAIGNPFGLGHTVTSGIVSAKGRVIGAGPYDDFIQTDASINPGNSGGPLFNMRGELVGINTAILPYGQGIGFAIPVNTARPLIPQLVTQGEVTRGYLGVSIQAITPDLAKALHLKEAKGVLVGEVVPSSPAEQAGIRRGDILVAFNGSAVKDPRDLASAVAETPVGQEVSVSVLRDEVEQQLRLKVGKLRSEESKAEHEGPRQPTQAGWGLQLQEVNPETARRLGLTTDRAVVVVGVEPGSPADRADLRQGDAILEINHQAVSSIEDFKKAIAMAEDKDATLLLVRRNRDSFFVALTG